jgi:UDP-glucose 4-epimerase
MAAVTFRYFNISGSYKSSTGQLLVENHEKETHLIPKIIYNLVNNKETAQIEIYGNNWSTNDGSCVRDYLHILDLAHAHLLALENLEEGVHKVFNLGSGTGYSVFEVIDEIEKIVGAKLNRVISPPRLGDPAILLAEIDKAKDDLGWIPKADLSQIVFDSLQGFK